MKRELGTGASPRAKKAMVIPVIMTACTVAGEPPEDGLPQTKDEARAQAAGGKTDWGLIDVCEARGWYQDGICDEMWFCDADPDCIHPLPRGEPTRYPIVFVHGFGGQRDDFASAAAALELDGHQVYRAELPPYNAISVRAEVLEKEVRAALARFDADQVNIIAHSQGGIDARTLASPAGRDFGDRIASITTIGSPHRGTPVADFVLAILDGAHVPDSLLDAIAEAFGLTFNELAGDSDVRAALSSFSEENAESLSEDALPNAPGVYYQSWTGVSTPLGLFNDAMRDELRDTCDGEVQINGHDTDSLSIASIVTWLVVIRQDLDFDWDELRLDSPAAIAASIRAIAPAIEERLAELPPNDGRVAVSSAAWGNFRGCLPADHPEETGKPLSDGFNPESGFHPNRFFRNVAYDLATRGL